MTDSSLPLPRTLPPLAPRTARSTPRSRRWSLRSAISHFLVFMGPHSPPDAHTEPRPGQGGSGRPSQLCRCPREDHRSPIPRRYAESPPAGKSSGLGLGRRVEHRLWRRAGRGVLAHKTPQPRPEVEASLQRENPSPAAPIPHPGTPNAKGAPLPERAKQGHSRPPGAGVMMGAYGGEEAAQADRGRGRSGRGRVARRDPRAVCVHPLH